MLVLIFHPYVSAVPSPFWPLNTSLSIVYAALYFYLFSYPNSSDMLNEVAPFSLFMRNLGIFFNNFENHQMVFLAIRCLNYASLNNKTHLSLVFRRVKTFPYRPVVQ